MSVGPDKLRIETKYMSNVYLSIFEHLFKGQFSMSRYRLFWRNNTFFKKQTCRLLPRLGRTDNEAVAGGGLSVSDNSQDERPRRW